MVGISKFWKPEEKSSALVKASFEKWRFKVVEKELGGNQVLHMVTLCYGRMHGTLQPIKTPNFICVN